MSKMRLEILIVKFNRFLAIVEHELELPVLFECSGAVCVHYVVCWVQSNRLGVVHDGFVYETTLEALIALLFVLGGLDDRGLLH